MRTENSIAAAELNLLAQLAESETETWSRINLALVHRYQLINENLAIISAPELVTAISQVTEIINDTLNITFQVLNEFIQFSPSSADMVAIYIPVGLLHCEMMCNWCVQFSDLVNRYRAQHAPLVPIPRISNATHFHVYRPIPCRSRVHRARPYVPVVVYQDDQKHRSPRKG